MDNLITVFGAFVFCMILAGELIGAWKQASEADRRFHEDGHDD